MPDILYAPIGARGVTKLLLERAFSALTSPRGKLKNFSGILYIAPTALKCKEARRLFHGIAKEAGVSTYVPPSMLTPRQLSKKLCQSRLRQRLVLPSYLRVPLLMKLSGAGVGQSTLLADFIAEMKNHFPNGGAAAVSKTLAPLLQELGIAIEVAERLQAALGTMETYEQALEKNNFIDEEDTVGLAAPLIAGGPRIEALVIDGFFELTPAETLLMESLMAQSPKCFVSVPVSENNNHDALAEDYIGFLKKSHSPVREEISPDTRAGRDTALSYHAYASKEAEVEEAARMIKKSYIAQAFTKLSRISLVLPSLSGYGDMIERVFEKYGVPCNLPYGSNSMRMRRARDLLGVVESAFDDYPSGSLSALLSSPYFDSMPEELRKWAPVQSLSGNTGGFKNWLALEDSPADELKQLKKSLSPLEAAGKKSADAIKGFSETLRRLGFSSKGFGDELEDRLRGLALASLIASNAVLPSSQFRDCLAHAIGSIGEETEGHGVQVMEFREARGFLEPKRLHFIGLRDGEIPSRPEMDFFVPERLRARLGLPTMKRHLALEDFLFKKLISSADSVHLSYPETEADKLFLPSIFISDGTRLTGSVSGIFSKEEELLARADKKTPYSAHMKEIHLLAGRGNQKSLHVTNIDGYRSCPRRYFIERLLKLEPPEAGDYGLEPAEIGTIFHAVMQRLLPFVRAAGRPDFETFRAAAVRALEDVLKACPHITVPWQGLLRESFLEMLPGLFEMEGKIGAEGYSFSKAELPLEGELAGLKLRGKADRIDAAGDGSHEIIDYKTGRADLNSSAILNDGATLQLFLYAALAGRAGMKISRVGIYSLRNLRLKFIPGKTDLKAGNTLDVFTEAALKYLEETAGLLAEGRYWAEPLNEAACKHCHERPYCPSLQGRRQGISEKKKNT